MSTTAFAILFPAPYIIEVSRLRQQLEEAHLAWATEWKRHQQSYELENIRFNHDPRWRKRVFSLQAARDGETWFWKATKIFVSFGGMSI